MNLKKYKIVIFPNVKGGKPNVEDKQPGSQSKVNG